MKLTNPLIARLRVPFAAGMVTMFTAFAMGAPSIGLNFVQSGDRVNDADENSLLPAESAGAPGLEQANWNNLGRWGDNIVLKDHSGAASGVTAAWDANNTWTLAAGAQATADEKMMCDYLDSTGHANTNLNQDLYSNGRENKPLVLVRGLGAWLAAQGATCYDVVIYSDCDTTDGRTGEFWLSAATGDHTAMGVGDDLITHVFIRDTANFPSNPIYAEVPLTSYSGPAAVATPGNFAVLDSLTADAFLLRTAEYSSRAVINGIQIVAHTSGKAPRFASQPASAVAYLGQTARLTLPAVGALPMTFQWKKGGVNVTDGPNVSGATTATLTLRNLTAADQGAYTVQVGNSFGSLTSDAANLTVLTPTANSYAEKIVADKPIAFWRFSETTFGDTVARDNVGGYNGTYLAASLNGASGVVGPQAPAYPGFETANTGLQTTYNTANSWVTTPALGIVTNEMTITTWIYPTANQANFTGLYFSRSGTNVVGFGYGNANQLGYNWGERAAAWDFVSGLIPPTNEWSLASLVITPSNSVIYLCNANGVFSATNNLANAPINMAGVGNIGTDNGAGRAFQGSIDEVAIFNHPLPGSEIYGLYKRGLGITAVKPIVSAPLNRTLFAGRTAKFSVTASGDTPLSFEWRKNNVALTDDTRISGSKTASLTISNVNDGDEGSYTVYVTNPAGSTTSAAATLDVVPLTAAGAYETALRAANPMAYWRLDEASGALVAQDYWGGLAATHSSVTTGIEGPRPPEFAGLESANNAAQYDGIASGTSTEASVNNLAQFSILGWFNADGQVGTRVGLFGQNDVVEFGFHGADSSGMAEIAFWTPNGGYAALSQTNIVAGQWYMVAAVGDGTKVSLHLLSKTGALQATASGSTTNYGQSVYPFRIGAGILDATGGVFPGKIDEVALFDRALSAGELATLFGAAFTGGALPPTMAVQPASRTLYAGFDLQLSASVLGSTPMNYEWRKNGMKVTDGGNVSGAASELLNFTAVTAANAGEYVLVAWNSAGSVTSSPAMLNVIAPVPGSYEDTVVSLTPHAYYRLNEAQGSTTAYDYFGGFNGAYGATATYSQGVPGVTNPPFVGFESTNTAVQLYAGASGNSVTAPFGATATNAITFTAWVYPMGTQSSWAGILMSRTSGSGGMGYNDEQMLAYTWNADSTWSFDSGLVIPTEQWSFVAVVIQPDRGVLYHGNSGALRFAENVVAHTPDALGNNWRIGTDDTTGTDTGARGFNGIIDEVAVFDYSLSAEQIQMLYGAATAGPPVRIQVRRAANGDLILTWPEGTLLEADSVAGPYNPSSITSGTPIPPAAQSKFYRVRVK